MRRDDDLVRAEEAQGVLHRLERLGVADLALCVDPASRSRARLSLQPLLRLRARAVLVRGPVPERRVQRRADDEHAARCSPRRACGSPRAAAAPPTVSFAITRIRRSSSRSGAASTVCARRLRRGASAATQTSRPCSSTKTSCPAHGPTTSAAIDDRARSTPPRGGESVGLRLAPERVLHHASITRGCRRRVDDYPHYVDEVPVDPGNLDAVVVLGVKWPRKARIVANVSSVSPTKT